MNGTKSIKKGEHQMTKKEIALSYLEKGLSVIPVYSPKMVRSKPPKKFLEDLNEEKAKNAELGFPREDNAIVRELFIRQCKKPILAWKKYQSELPTKDEVHHWFTIFPDANIGIVTGKVSNLVIFDLDSEQAERFAEELGGFPETVKVKSGKGYHVYMRHPGFEIRNDVNKKLDLDIRADGGQILAPPSMHGTGSLYEWVPGFSINDIEPAECLPWMTDYLETVAKSVNSDVKKAKPEPKDTAEPEAVDEKEDSYEAILRNGCSSGNRNDTATKLIGHLFKTSINEKELWEIVSTWNLKNNPPLGESELRTTFDSVRDAEKRNRKSKEKEKIKADTLLDTVQIAENEYSRDYTRVPFARDNLKSLEQKMDGGLAGGRLYVVGGIPTSGKTALLNNIADNICLNGSPVLFFSYDDGRAELRYRSLSRFGPHNIEAFNLGKAKGIKEICSDPVMQSIMKLKYVVQSPANVENWDDLIEQIKGKHGRTPVVIIDYLRKLRTEAKTTDERLRVDDIVGKLTDLAKKHNTPVVAISELARDSYKSGQRLSMASFKESGSIEYEASWLGILGAVEEVNGEYQLKDNWDKIIEQDGNIEVMIFKAKRGTGTTGVVHLKVDREKMTVKDRDVPRAKPAPKTTKKTKF